jgi:hypothetical protein
LPSTATRPSHPRFRTVAATSAARVDLLRLHALCALVEARDLHQLLDEATQATDVGDQELRRPPRLRRHPVEVLGQQRGLAHEGGQRRSQLVRHVGGEAPLARLGGRERGDLGLERGGHLVERLRPGAELVLPLDRQPRLEQAFRQRVRGLARPGDGPKRSARQQDPRAGGEEDEDADPAEQDVPQLRQLVPEAVLGEEEVEVRPVRGGRTRDHVAGSADLCALVAQLATGHDLAKPVRHGLQRDLRAREVHAPAAGRDGLEVAAAPVRVDEVVRVGGPERPRDVEVAPRLGDARVDRVRQQVVADDEVRPRAERGRGEPDASANVIVSRRRKPPAAIPCRRASRSAEAVADPAHRLDQLRLLRVVLDLRRSRWIAASTSRESPR